MKYLDTVKIVADKPDYQKKGISKGEIGTIIVPEIKNSTFWVVFENLRDKNGNEVYQAVFVGDLQLVKENSLVKDDHILKALATPDIHWWCKVQDGYIVNLLGERKNIPYDYNS